MEITLVNTPKHSIPIKKGHKLTNLLNNDIPGVVGARAAHDSREDSVGGVHRARALTEPTDHRVVCRRHLQWVYGGFRGRKIDLCIIPGRSHVIEIQIGGSLTVTASILETIESGWATFFLK